MNNGAVAARGEPLRRLAVAAGTGVAVGCVYAVLVSVDIEYRTPVPGQLAVALELGAAVALPMLAWAALRIAVQAVVSRVAPGAATPAPTTAALVCESAVVAAVVLALLAVGMDVFLGPIFYPVERAEHPVRWLLVDLLVAGAIVAAVAVVTGALRRLSDRSAARVCAAALVFAVAANLVAGGVDRFRRPSQGGASAGPGGGRTGPPAAGMRQRTGLSVVVIGLDGASWNVIGPMIEVGAMPALAALMARGSRGVLVVEPPYDSPRVWTTIATGRRAAEHGVVSYLASTFPGGVRLAPEIGFNARWRFPFYAFGALLKAVGGAETHPIDADFRRADSIWEIVSDRGGTVNVVNWWASHPPRPVRGQIATDAYFREWLWMRFPKPASGGSALVHPSDLALSLDGWVRPPEAYDAAALAEYGDFDAGDWAKLRDTMERPEAAEVALTQFKWAVAVEENVLRVAVGLARERPADLTMVLSGLEDKVNHYFVPYRWPERFDGLDPDQVRRYGRIVDVHHRRLDGRLAPLLGLAGERTVVLVVSDHGFQMLRDNPMTPEAHSADGVLVGAGGPVRRGAAEARITEYDVAPTVLYLLGVAAPPGLPGRVAAELFDEAFVAAHPPGAEGR